MRLFTSEVVLKDLVKVCGEIIMVRFHNISTEYWFRDSFDLNKSYFVLFHRVGEDAKVSRSNHENQGGKQVSARGREWHDRIRSSHVSP